MYTSVQLINSDLPHVPVLYLHCRLQLRFYAIRAIVVSSVEVQMCVLYMYVCGILETLGPCEASLIHMCSIHTRGRMCSVLVCG